MFNHIWTTKYQVEKPTWISSWEFQVVEEVMPGIEELRKQYTELMISLGMKEAMERSGPRSEKQMWDMIQQQRKIEVIYSIIYGIIYGIIYSGIYETCFRWNFAAKSKRRESGRDSSVLDQSIESWTISSSHARSAGYFQLSTWKSPEHFHLSSTPNASLQFLCWNIWSVEQIFNFKMILQFSSWNSTAVLGSESLGWVTTFVDCGGLETVLDQLGKIERSLHDKSQYKQLK